MNATRIARAIAALTLCLTPAALTTPVAADPVALCTPDNVACVAGDAAPADCEAGPACVDARLSAAACAPEACARADARACPPGGCTTARADVCLPAAIGCLTHVLTPAGGIERPATGTITITESPTSPAAMVLTGVFAPAAGEFACTLTAPANAERTVRCVPTNGSYDWYCAGWVLTAATHTYNSQVAAQASCADFQGFPGWSTDRTLWTDFACCTNVKTATAAGLTWFVSGAITCQAWGYSAGPKPMGDYSVTCNEPGASAPR